jgi:signal transduction histidine kinase
MTRATTRGDSRGSMRIEQLPGLVQQMERAAARLAALRTRASEELLEDAIMLEAFQELDSAHEELRVAEEHLHTQADQIEFAHDTLEAERRRYMELFNYAPEPYLVTDVSGVVTESNRLAAELLNIDAAFIVGKPLVMFMERTERGRASSLLQEFALRDAVVHCELCLQPRHATVPVRVHASVCRATGLDGQARALRWLLRPAPPSAQPSAREAELELQLRTRTRELADTKYLLDRCLLREQDAQPGSDAVCEDRFVWQARLAAAAALHDAFNQPLRAIAGLLEIASADAVSARAGQAALLHATQEVHAFTQVLTQLVDGARLADGACELEVVSLDLAALLERALAECRPLAVDKQIRLVTDLASNVPELLGDAERLHELLSNLIGNALKFTPDRGEVHVSLRHASDALEIGISGTGCDPARLSGFAAALHSARRLVALHGASLTCEARSGDPGVRVVVRFALLHSGWRS